VPMRVVPGGLAEQRQDMIPRRCQRAGVAGIRLLTQAPAVCQSIKCSGRGSGRGVTGLWRPRTRRRIARGGTRPSSEVVSCPRGRQPLEQGGEPPEGYRGRSVGGPLWFLWAVGLPALGCDHRQRVFRISSAFICVYHFSKKGFSLVIRGPLWLSPTLPRSVLQLQRARSHGKGVPQEEEGEGSAR
jgi:hypothetical protein